VNLSKQHL